MLKLLGARLHHSRRRIIKLVLSENQKCFSDVNKKGLYRSGFYQAERRDTAIQLYWTQTRSSLGLCAEPCADPASSELKRASVQQSLVRCQRAFCWLVGWGCRAETRIRQLLPMSCRHHHSLQQPAPISRCSLVQASVRFWEHSH